MNNLSIFQAPKNGEVTLCEVDGRVHCVNCKYANVSAFTSSLENHPKIQITPDMLHPRNDEGKSLFVTVNEPFLKRLIQAYYENGILEVLNTAEQFGPTFIKKFIHVIFMFLNGIRTLQYKLTSRSLENNLTMIANMVQTRFWFQSVIRYIAWHDYDIKIAVATSDDAVRIYSHNSNIVPILKCKQQQNITCLSWRPLSNTEIAVGCETGIFVWNFDHSPVITRPSINNAVILHRINHVPVISIAWNVGGDILASAAASDSVILIWHIERDETSSLRVPGERGNCLVKWSPKGNKLLSASTGLSFRVWDCQTWKSECWNVLTGRVQASCWSPCGSILLFVSTTEPIIYALSFIQTDLIFTSNSENSANLAIPLYDLSRGEIDGVVIGGVVQNMEWDPSKNNVAVLFRDTNYIALFKVILGPSLKLSPCCLIAGVEDERPICIAFQGNFSSDACLSIGWSTGRVQHFPIVGSEVNTSSSLSQDVYDNSSFYNSFRSP